MAREDRIPHGFAKDSLTTAHLEQGIDTINKSLTTAHIQQKIESATPVQNQGGTGNTSSGNSSGQQGSNSNNQK